MDVVSTARAVRTTLFLSERLVRKTGSSFPHEALDAQGVPAPAPLNSTYSWVIALKIRNGSRVCQNANGPLHGAI